MAVARAIRDIVPVAGMGGEIQIYTPVPSEEIMGPIVHHGYKLEVGRWKLNHIFLLAEVTHSGSNGAILRKKVAHDFNFELEIPWNAMFKALRTDATCGFMESLLAGQAETDYITCIKFNLGDATQWTNQKRAYYYAPRCKLENVFTVCDSTGTEIIRMVVRGVGTSLLRGYWGEDWKFGGEMASANPIPGLAG